MGAGPTPSDPGLPLAFRIYVVVLVGAALAVAPAGIGAALALEAPWEALLWIAFIAAANLLVIPMSPRMGLDASLGAPVSVASAVVLAPPLALLVNTLGFTHEREWRGDTSPWLIAFNRSQMGLSAGAAGLAAHAQPYGTIAGALVAVVVFQVVNTLAVSLHLQLRRGVGPGRAARDSAAPFPHFLVDFGLVTLLAILVVIAYEEVGVLAVVLIALPLWLGYSALRSAREAEDRAEQLAARVRELETLHALGAELLGVRDVEGVARTGAQALATALDTGAVEVRLDGAGDPQRRALAVPGAEPAVVLIPDDGDDESLAVAEAVAGLLGMAITRLRLEDELSEVERARTALSSQIIEEGARERARVALQIHDEVLPALAAAEIQADNVRSALKGEEQATADQLAAATRETVHDGIGRLREVLEALRRQNLTPGNLCSALLEALAELRLEQGITGDLRAPEALPPLPLAVEVLVLETVRGCLTNVARHAEAETVTVEVAVREDAIAVTVGDDGRGFDPSAVSSGHHGLALMRQRVELARGRLRVESAPGSGTRVHVEVPV